VQYNYKCCAEFKREKKLTARQDILDTESVIVRSYFVMPEHLLYALVAFWYAFDCNLLET